MGPLTLLLSSYQTCDDLFAILLRALAMEQTEVGSTEPVSRAVRAVHHVAVDVEAECASPLALFVGFFVAAHLAIAVAEVGAYIAGITCWTLRTGFAASSAGVLEARLVEAPPRVRRIPPLGIGRTGIRASHCR